MPDMELWVPGIPAPAGSKKAFYIKKLKRAVVTDACKRTKPWQATVAAFAMEAWEGKPLLTGPVRAEFVFRLTRSKGHYGSGRNASRLKPSAPAYPTGRPDLLKLTRAVEDALTGIVWADDALIVHETQEKVYGDRPGVMIRIAEIRLTAERNP